MKISTLYNFRILPLVLMLSTSVFGFEYTLEKTFLKNPSLVQNELLYKSNKSSTELKTKLLKQKFNIALNTIKYSLHIEKNRDINSLYFDSNKDLLKVYNQIIKDINSLDKKQIATIKDKLEKATSRSEIQNNKYQNTLSSFKRYTKVEYKPSNLTSIIKNIKNPANPKDAQKLFNSKNKSIQKAVLETFVTNDIKNQIQSYYTELNTYEKNQDILENQMAILLKKDRTKENILSYFNANDEITNLKLKLIENKYNLLFQKCKISFVLGNLLKDVKNKKVLVNKSSKTPKIITALKKKEVKKSKTSKPKKKNPFKHTKLKRIHFVGNDIEVSSYSIYIVERNAELLSMMKDYELELHGHSDNKGDKKGNYNLALQRAIKTKEALVKFGANPDKIKVFSHSDEKPIATNKTKKGRLLNRRVEFILKNSKEK